MAPYWKVRRKTSERDILAIELKEGRMVGVLQSYYVCRGTLDDGRPCLTVAPSGEWAFWVTEAEPEINEDVQNMELPEVQ